MIDNAASTDRSSSCFCGWTWYCHSQLFWLSFLSHSHNQRVVHATNQLWFNRLCWYPLVSSNWRTTTYVWNLVLLWKFSLAKLTALWYLTYSDSLLFVTTPTIPDWVMARTEESRTKKTNNLNIFMIKHIIWHYN